MILINLVRAQGVKISKVEANIDAFQEVDEKDIQKQAGLKIVLFLIGPIVLYLYQTQNLSEIKTKIATDSGRLSELSAIAEKGKQTVKETTKIKEEQQKLQAQINTIEDLRKGRLKEVKVLDLIQKQMPTRMWLVDLRYSQGDATMTLNGIAKTDADLNSFMEGLQSSALLKEVSLINSSEEALKNETVKKFEIRCVLEKGAES